jgi:hypothetical protein
MALWAQFLLDSARVDGVPLISGENFVQLFQPQVLVSEEEFYESIKLGCSAMTVWPQGFNRTER